MKNKCLYRPFNEPTTAVIPVATVDQKIMSNSSDRYQLLQGFELNYVAMGANPFNLATDNPIIHCWHKILVDGGNVYSENRQPVNVGTTFAQYYPFNINTIFIDPAAIAHRMHSNQYHFVSGGIALIYPGEKVDIFVSNTMTNVPITINYTLFLQEIIDGQELEEIAKLWNVKIGQR